MALTSKELIDTIEKMCNVVQSSNKVLIAEDKLSQWIQIVNAKLLTDEVVSSFDVLKSQVQVSTKSDRRIL